MRILDLDNCIADDGWRVCLIWRQEKNVMERYHDYHTAAIYDNLGNEDLFAGDEPNAIITARPLLYRELTVKWLARQRIPYVHLIMRNNNDPRPSVEIKSLQLQWLLTEYGVRKEDISCAYDDRPDVVQMYRELHGIPAERRFIHEIPYVSYCP